MSQNFNEQLDRNDGTVHIYSKPHGTIAWSFKYNDINEETEIHRFIQMVERNYTSTYAVPIHHALEWINASDTLKHSVTAMTLQDVATAKFADLRSFTNLCHLRMYDTGDAVILLPHKLTHLCLYGVILSNQFMCPLPPTLENLAIESEDIAHEALEHFAKGWSDLPSLHTMQFSLFWCLDTLDWLQWIPATVTGLYLDDCISNDDELLTVCKLMGDRLEEIIVSANYRNRGFKGSTLRQALSALTNVKRLGLVHLFHDSLDWSALSVIPEQQLQHLSLRFNKSFKCDDLKYIPKHLKSLDVTETGLTNEYDSDNEEPCVWKTTEIAGPIHITTGVHV